MSTKTENPNFTSAGSCYLNPAEGDHTPPPIVDRLLHQGDTLAVAANPKCHKSWALCDLALSVASGAPWLGFQCARRPVLLVDLHMHRETVAYRLQAICREKQLPIPENLAVWLLRGRRCSLSDLLAEVERWSNEAPLGLLLLDPIYKIAGIADTDHPDGPRQLAHALAQFIGQTQVTLAFTTELHAAKAADTAIALRPHAQQGHYRVSVNPRNLPPLKDFIVRWECPLLRVGEDRQRLARLVRPHPNYRSKTPEKGPFRPEPAFSAKNAPDFSKMQSQTIDIKHYANQPGSPEPL